MVGRVRIIQQLYRQARDRCGSRRARSSVYISHIYCNEAARGILPMIFPFGVVKLDSRSNISSRAARRFKLKPMPPAKNRTEVHAAPGIAAVFANREQNR